MKWIDLNEVFAAELSKKRPRRLLPIEVMNTNEIIELARRQKEATMSDETMIWNPHPSTEDFTNLLAYTLGALKRASERGAMLSLDSKVCGVLLAEIERLKAERDKAPEGS